MKNMSPDKTLDLIKQKYAAFPQTINPKERKIGVELEFPIICSDGTKPDINVLKKLLTELLPELHFTMKETDYEGYWTKGQNYSGDLISYEYCPAILEISPAPEKDINILHAKIDDYLKKIQKHLEKKGLTLLSMGINPFRWSLELTSLKNPYYYMLSKFFTRFDLKKENSYVHAQAFICSNQTQIDYSLEELHIIKNLHSSLGWVKALLFSDSPSQNFHKRKCLCMRDLLWEDNPFAYRPKNVGILNKLYHTPQDVLFDVLDNSIFYVKRENKLIYFTPISLRDFLNTEIIAGWEVSSDGENPTLFYPQPTDIQFSRPYNEVAITPRGTIETKGDCQQPFNALMTPTAFHMGLANNMQKIYKHTLKVSSFINEKNFFETRRAAIYLGYEIQKNLNFDIKKYIFEILTLIKEGLIKRGKNEEKHLEVLFSRLENSSNPATEWINEMEKGLSPVEIIKKHKLCL